MICVSRSRDGVFGLRIEHERRVGEIVEQRVQLFVEQRQPVLHARIAAALADGLIERIVAARRAEGRDIALAEAADGLARRAGTSRHRHEIEPAHVRCVRCVSGSKVRIDSSVSPKKSSRTGCSMPAGNRSRMPPRTAYSPALAHGRGRDCSRCARASDDDLSMSTTLPGATEAPARRRARAAARVAAAALTVVRTTSGASLPLEACERGKRRHALARRCRHAATPGRRAGSPRPGIAAPRCRARRTRSARASCAMRGPSRQMTARLTAGRAFLAALARARSRQHQPFGAVGDVRRASVALAAAPAGSQESAGHSWSVARPLAWNACICVEAARPLDLAAPDASPVSHGIEIGVRDIDQTLELVELGLVEIASCASAKRPTIRSISRVPRCQQRYRRRCARIEAVA